MTRLRSFPLATLALAILVPATATTASALTATTTFGVSANVIKACVVSASSVAFGTYNPVGGSANNATGTLTVACTATTGYTTALSAGTGTGSTVSNRKMTGSTVANLLAYSLYQDSAHTVNWGNTPGTDTPAAATGTGMPVASTVYGQISSGTPGAIDTYSDTITVTVTY